MRRPPDHEPPVDFDALLKAAATEILSHEDPRRFRAWIYERIHDFIVPGAQGALDADGWRALATAIGTDVWNATPLPGNRFRPRPLPRIGRNDPCPCGSGRKHKRCCGAAPPFEAFTTELMWTFVLDALPRERRTDAMRAGHVPVSSLAGTAEAHVREDRPARAVALLEPLFAGDLAELGGEDHEFALDVLVDAYDLLGHTVKKRTLIDRVATEAARSPLRAGARQRLASIRMDENDRDGAWEAFEHARRDDPDSPSLAHVEVLLLAGDGRVDEAADRADFWRRRLLRLGFDDDAPLVDWLGAVAEDPDGALTDLGIRSNDGDGAVLLAWLDGVAERPLPSYALRDAPPAPESPADEDEHLASRLRKLGIPPEEIEAALSDLRERMLDADATAPHDDDATGGPPIEDFDDRLLVGPPALREVERRWRDVFPLDKPFSVHDHPFSEEDVWAFEADWMVVLGEHGEGFDSIDVLDDLATAVMEHAAFGEPSFERRVLVPLLERVHAIVEHALAGVPDPRLSWLVGDNRPALRSLVRLAMWNLRRGDLERGVALAERVLALNPHDNHGLRTIVVDEHLRAGRDEAALALAERHPDDMLAATRYGRVLALYRLGRTDEAREVLAEAVEDLPRIPRALTRKRVRRPKLSETGVSIGGEDQAWVYREEMRDVWAATPGALEWLKRAVTKRG